MKMFWAIIQDSFIEGNWGFRQDDAEYFFTFRNKEEMKENILDFSESLEILYNKWRYNDEVVLFKFTIAESHRNNMMRMLFRNCDESLKFDVYDAYYFKNGKLKELDVK